MTSSFSISLMPSASDWSMPQGPCRLGPMRNCIQATTLRSHTMENSTVTIRKAKQKTALMTTSHQGSVPNIERSSAATYGLMPHLLGCFAGERGRADADE